MTSCAHRQSTVTPTASQRPHLCLYFTLYMFSCISYSQHFHTSQSDEVWSSCIICHPFIPLSSPWLETVCAQMIQYI
ncbi:hypothetical protein PAXRUDRAFT_631098 [Paxillus rubicundulus Ve08.2h10]|uniref:Uncharacterized protein n=1 Tax=Paxillus rubicundulus Ve08.2h10 TaxID=930991 RepID=A0A0D0CZ18_9AGAM|nr:hypothetical protein PAXRUDRAFT_631098 [Paxillus rubicundulus Ve08.2h10]